MNLKTRTGASLLGVAAAAVLALGCGGDDEVSSETLPLDEYSAEVNELCTTAYDEIRERGEELNSGETPDTEELVNLLEEEVAPRIDQLADDIAAVGVPEGQEDQATELVEQMRAQVDALESDPEGLLNGSPSEELVESGQRQEELFTELDLEECSANSAI